MSAQPVKALPKMGSAAVCPQWVRCGKPGCRCARGDLHGPYYYLFWRAGGRLRKRYLKAAEVAPATLAGRRNREDRRRAREAAKEWRQHWRTLLTGLREGERHEPE